MKNLLIMATLLVVASSVVNAQQQEPTLKPSMSAPRAEGPPPLLLEVVANPALPPGYSNVNGPTELGKWLATSNFVHVPGVTGFVPSAASSITVHIRSAVFSDLSYEGDVNDTCFMEKTAIGRKVYLTEVLSLLDSQLAETFTDHAEAARQFKEKFEALRYYDGYSAKASSISPACKDMAQGAVNTVNVMKLTMLRDLNQIITTKPRPPFSFRTWMETRRENYKNWLARLVISQK